MDSSLKLLYLYFIILLLSFGTNSTLTMREKFEQWVIQYGRVYGSEMEKEKRFHIFEKNANYIDNFNNGNHTFKLGINQFSDMTNEEVNAKCCRGLLPPRNESSSSVTKDSKFENLDNNSIGSLDWREKGVVTNVKNQGGRGDFWAFAATAAIEGIYKIKTGNLLSFSEQNLIDCVGAPFVPSCNDGLTTKAFEYVKFKGIATEEEYPYVAEQRQCNTTKVGVKIKGYRTLPQNNINALMSVLNKQLVSVSLDGNGFRHYAGGLYDGGCSNVPNHAVTVIGYGTDDVSGKNYWLVKNSWGKMWGENGYMKVVMDESVCPLTLFASYPIM